MGQKFRESFPASGRLVWTVDPRTRTAQIYTGPADLVPITEEQALEGGDVLPGFSVTLRAWFTQARRR